MKMNELSEQELEGISGGDMVGNAINTAISIVRVYFKLCDLLAPLVNG